MTLNLSRRKIVSSISGLTTLGLLPAQTPSLAAFQPQEWWPRQDPELVKELVTVAHSDLKRVRELVERRPALANASIDWGFGDWEDGLGAAAHTGRREIAEVLLAHGARISIFAAAMLGHLDVVKAFVTASPGVQRTPGPHGITLLAHARAGGAGSEAVVKYLEATGDADVRPSTQPLENSERDAVVGRYGFGPGLRDVFEIDVSNDRLGITRPGSARRFLMHTGGLVFFPSGVPSVKIAFARENGKIARMIVADPAVFLIAKRQ